MKESIASLRKTINELKDDLHNMIVMKHNAQANIQDAQKLVEVYREVILRQQQTINDLINQTKGFEVSWARPFQVNLALSGLYYSIEEELNHKCEEELERLNPITASNSKHFKESL